MALDGNLTLTLLEDIARSPAFVAADLRVAPAPASPSQTERLLPFVNAGRATLYVNLEEAGLLCQAPSRTAPARPRRCWRGAHLVLVTDGGAGYGLRRATPPEVMVTRVTGAGDTFMVAHIAVETGGADRGQALFRALSAAAAYVSGVSPL